MDCLGNGGRLFLNSGRHRAPAEGASVRVGQFIIDVLWEMVRAGQANHVSTPGPDWPQPQDRQMSEFWSVDAFPQKQTGIYCAGSRTSMRPTDFKIQSSCG